MGLFSNFRKKNKDIETRQFFPLLNQTFGTGLFSVEKCAAVDAAVSRISNTISTLPLEMYQYTSKGVQDIWSNPLAKLLKDPAVEETSTLFYQTLVRHVLLKGNGYIFKHRNPRGEVVALELIDPMRIRVERFEDGRKKYDITGEQGGIYTDRDIIHIPLLGEGYNGTWGMSPCEAHWDIIKQNTLIQEFIAVTMNQGIGSRILVKLDKDAFKVGSQKNAQLVQEMNEYFQKFVLGQNNSGKPIITPPSTEIGTIEINDLVKSEIIKLYDKSNAEVYKLFNIPPEVLDSSQQKYGSLEAKYQDFLRVTIHPLCSHIAKCFEKGLFKPEERVSCFLQFNYESLLDTDREKKVKNVMEEFHGGIFTLNEARRKLGLQSVDNEVEGDTRWIPSNLVPLTEDNIDAYLAKSKTLLGDNPASASTQEDKQLNHNDSDIQDKLI